MIYDRLIDFISFLRISQMRIGHTSDKIIGIERWMKIKIRGRGEEIME